MSGASGIAPSPSTVTLAGEIMVSTSPGLVTPATSIICPGFNACVWLMGPPKMACSPSCMMKVLPTGSKRVTTPVTRNGHSSRAWSRDSSKTCLMDVRTGNWGSVWDLAGGGAGGPPADSST